MNGWQIGPEDYEIWYWRLLWANSAEVEAERQVAEAQKSGW